jgi:L-ascorbate metabolism protein UlaG (beta-lactamase superfamily)
MISSTNFKASVSMTHIGTATAIIEIDGVRFITNPMFLPAGSHPQPIMGPDGNPTTLDLVTDQGPALQLEELPHINCVLLSHEDHIDNLDETGRLLLNARHVLTTVDGARKLAPRPSVQGKNAWETTTLVLEGKEFRFTWTSAQHIPGGECTGFIIEYEGFGKTNGLPNVLWFSGDTVYTEDLKLKLADYHITIALVNLGSAHVGDLQITMSGHDAADFVKDHNPDVLVPMHYAEWQHFTEHDKELKERIEAEAIGEKVQWLPRGESVRIV